MIPFLPPGKPQFEVDRFLDFAFSKMDITQEEFVSTQEELELKGTSIQVFTQLHFFFERTYTAEMKAHFFRLLQKKEGIDAIFLGKQEKYLKLKQLIDSSFDSLATLYSTLAVVAIRAARIPQNTPREVLFRVVCPTIEIFEQMLFYYDVFLSNLRDELDKSELVVESSGEIETTMIQNLVKYFTQVVRQQFCHQKFRSSHLVDFELKDSRKDKHAEILIKWEQGKRWYIQRIFLEEMEILFLIQSLYQRCGIL